MTTAREQAWREKVAAELRTFAAADEELAAQYDATEHRPGSAAASGAPNARARAAAKRLQADHVEAGTWLEYLDSIGRGIRRPA